MPIRSPRSPGNHQNHSKHDAPTNEPKKKARLTAIVTTLAVAAGVGLVPVVASTASTITTALSPVSTSAPEAAAQQDTRSSFPASTAKRVSSSDRYEAAVAISKSNFPEKADAVYVANGQDHPDARVSVRAATKSIRAAAEADGPLLLTKLDKLPEIVAKEIKRLMPKKIVIAGGLDAVSDKVLDQLTELAPTTVPSDGLDLDGDSRDRIDIWQRIIDQIVHPGSNWPGADKDPAPEKTTPAVAAPAPATPSTTTPPSTTSEATTPIEKTPEATTAPKTDPPATTPPTATPADSKPRPNPTDPSVNPPGPNTSEKKVFAHYFPPYPLSLENKPGGSDYYANNYLTPGGENGIHSQYGGLLRDRPVEQQPVSGDWKTTNLIKEVNQAADAGIDGFAVDILSLSGSNWDTTVRLMDAAVKSGRDFTIVPMIDGTTSASKASPAEVARKLAELYTYKSAHKLDSGEFVLSSFKVEGQSVAWWGDVKSALANTHNVKTAFIAVFLNASDANMQRFAPISYGFGNWGVRTPTSVRSTPDYVAQAAKYGKKWMEPVAVQDARPRNSIYAEAGNTETLRAMWQNAINDDADFVQLVTWNDYSESTSFAPSEAHGNAFLDINAYYLSKFKTGSAPEITDDSLYITHRIHSYDARPSYGNQTMSPTLSGTSTAPRDTVEVLTMLTAPATITATIGGKTYTEDAPAGVSTVTFPLAVGSVSASAERGGQTILKVNSPHKVVSNPYVLDMQYFAASSRD